MTKVGIIGCGNISGIYLKSPQVFPILDIVACADIDHARAEATAAEHGLHALSVADLLADPDIEIVVNLTIPAAHAEVATRDHRARQVGLQRKAVGAEHHRRTATCWTRRLRPVCASAARPTPSWAAGFQTCRKLIDDGWIGEPIAATAFMMSHGHEHWHPSPEFYYQPGGGPMFDMGPYYLTALVSLMGPVATSPAQPASPSPSAPSPANPSTAQRSQSKSRPMSSACSTSPAGPSARSSRPSTCGPPNCRASKSTARKARSASPTPIPLAARCVCGARAAPNGRRSPSRSTTRPTAAGWASPTWPMRSAAADRHRASGELAYPRAGDHGSHPRRLRSGSTNVLTQRPGGRGRLPSRWG